MFFITLLLSIFSFGSVSAANGHGDLGNGTYLNPIMPGDFPDPSIVRVGKDYYMTHSAFDYVPGLTVFHSTDLVNWEPISFALTKYLGSIWAPDISYYDNKYWIYFTIHGKQNTNAVVYADSPYGPWSEPIDLHLRGIDPCLVVGEDGQRWLFYSGGNRVKLAPDGLSILPETIENVYKGWQIPRTWITEGFALEGPKMRKIGDTYYYINAEGGTAGPATSHMVVQARSKSVDGPWIDAPNNPLIHTWNASEKWWSKGHGSIIDDAKGNWWIVYHSYENGYQNLGRQTLLEPLKMNKDGWLEAPVGTGIEKPLKMPFKNTTPTDRLARLSEFRVGLDWKYYKQYDASRTTLDSNGTLLLKAQGKNPAESAPLMFVSGAHNYEISACFEVDDMTTAGLVIYYNADFYVGMGIDKERLHRWRKAIDKGGRQNSYGNKVWMKLRIEDHVVSGFYSTDGKTWQREAWANEISGYNHNTLYDFQSILPGVFAYGEGTAKISEFKYEER